MKFQSHQAFRAIVLFAFFAFLIKIHLSGDILKYVNPKYSLLSKTAAYFFCFLFFVQCTRIWSRVRPCDHHGHHGCNHTHGHSRSPFIKGISYFVLIFPLLTGFLLPAKILDASAAANKGVTLGSHSPGTGTRIEMKKEEYDKQMEYLNRSEAVEMNNEAFEPYFKQISEEPQKYIGKTIKMRGFVFKEAGFQANQLALTRFLVTHCIADASIIGFLTEFNEAYTIEEDTWLEVEGTIRTTNYDGAEMPLLKITSWKVIKEPKEPYVYPVYIKVI